MLTRLHALADQRRDDVRRVWLEIVARAIQIDRQQEDAVEAILLAIRLALHQQHLFRQAIGGVGLLWIAVPKVLFLERYGREFGVGANRADGNEFFDAAPPSFLHQLNTHDEVIIEELAGPLTIDSNAADYTR